MKRPCKSFSVIGLTRAGLVCFFAGLLCAGSSAWAASPLGPADSPQINSSQSSIPAPTGSQIGFNLNRYITQGYTVIGRTRLASVNAQKISFPGDEKNKGAEIVLTGKQVSVIDETGLPVTFSSLRPGTEVYVCYKASSVVICVVSDSKVGVSQHAR